MRNATRRNRNIGTAKQGHGQANKLTISNQYAITPFYERLTTYKKTERIINGHAFLFVVEDTNSHYQHACTVDDIAHMMGLIDAADYGGPKLIVLRQPRKKEVILSPVWGRLIYSYAFENDYHPAIILEAVDTQGKIKWPRQLDPDDQRELDRLRLDGFQFAEDKRGYTAPMHTEYARNVQLYRTLPHELGHYLQYYNVVEKPQKEDERTEDWELRWNTYHRIPKQEREQYAHSYADNLVKALKEKGVVPFDIL